MTSLLERMLSEPPIGFVGQLLAWDADWDESKHPRDKVGQFATTEGSEMLTVYRGESAHNRGGNFYSPDAEWARQFTQSGRQEEVITRQIPANAVYDPPKPVYAGNPEAVDVAIAEARAAGKHAVRLSEGDGEPPSVYVFNPKALQQESDKLRISGMPDDAVIADPSMKEALERGAFDLKAREIKGDFITPGSKYEVMTVAKPTSDTVAYKARSTDKNEGLYNSRLAELRTEDKGQYEWQHAVPKSGVETEFVPLPDKDVLYRGMSAEEFAHIKATGSMESRGGYNLGKEQEGATFFSPSHETAISYADSFAPWQFKATFERPAYVVAIRKPMDARTTSPNDNEVGIIGSISNDHIVGVWKGEVYEQRPGTVDLLRVGNTNEFHEGSRSSLSNRLAWKRIANTGDA